VRLASKSDWRRADEGKRRRAAVTGRHDAPQPTRRLKTTGAHVGILTMEGGDGWPARLRQFGQRCHVSEQRREDLGEERADRRAPSVRDGGALTTGRPAQTRRWARVAAELGRPQRKQPNKVFSILNPFSN
jgi:hypothetical protein